MPGVRILALASGWTRLPSRSFRSVHMAPRMCRGWQDQARGHQHGRLFTESNVPVDWGDGPAPVTALHVRQGVRRWMLVRVAALVSRVRNAVGGCLHCMALKKFRASSCPSSGWPQAPPLQRQALPRVDAWNPRDPASSGSSPSTGWCGSDCLPSDGDRGGTASVKALPRERSCARRWHPYPLSRCQKSGCNCVAIL